MTIAVVKYILSQYNFIFNFLCLFPRRKPGEPPLVPGHWLFGNGKDFAEHAVSFLNGAKNKLGNVFTIRFFHQYWTIILDVHSFEKFSREKNFDFNLVQEQVNRNVFNYALVNARKMIGEAGQKVNGKYLFSYMDNFSKNLKMTLNSEDETEDVYDKTIINNAIDEKEQQQQQQKQQQQRPKEGDLYDKFNRNPADMDIERLLNVDPQIADDSDGWKQEYLREIASETFFSAVFYTIFGRGKSGDKYEQSFNPKVFHKNFDTFHKYFNYLWLGLPHKLFPEAMRAVQILAQQPTGEEMKSRDGCSDYMKYAINFMQAHR